MWFEVILCHLMTFELDGDLSVVVNFPSTRQIPLLKMNLMRLETGVLR